jgi:hypothetical protein
MILPQLQEALVVASDTMVARQRRRTQRFRLGLMTSAAVVTLGGGAVASQSLWAPLLGWEDGNRATVSQEPVPSAQEHLLGVLRRTQTAADRGAAAQAALERLSAKYVGVKVSDVRVVSATGSATSVLVPVSTVRASNVAAAGKTSTRYEAVCLYIAYGRSRNYGDQRCYSTTAISRGRAILISDDDVRGIVPDGVLTVRATPPAGRPYEAPVRDNVFSLPIAKAAGSVQLSWRDAQGAAVPNADGMTEQELTLPILDAPLPADMHDCGRALGGVVPKRLPCGPRSRTYAPGVGVTQYMTRKP